MALDSARALLEESGPDALHLRAIAASTGSGVSTLYHYFADKNALLSALAIEGFRELGEAMVKAMASGDYARRVDAAGAAYIGFWYSNLKLYALMHAESVLAANEEVRAAERAAFTTYQSSLIDEAGIPADKIEELSLVGWTLGRGTASVILSQGDISPEQARILAQKIFSGLQHMVNIRVTNALRQEAANGP
jgi:AcrR family transcriptional regulator